MDCASSGRETDLTGSVSQMSENGETPGTAEVNPISRENDLTEPQEPKLSTDQFYPSLDPTFSSTDEKEKIEKINSNELPPLPHSPVTDVKVSISEHSEAQKEISSSDGDAKSVHFEAERQSEPTKQSKATTDRPNSSESISVPNTPHDGQEREDNPKDVFSTQIDEETLAAAQQRRAQQGKLFSTEEWGPSRPPSVSLHQVVNNRVNEHYKAGLKHLEVQQYERAITAFSKAINLRSNQTIFYVKRAECYLQLCDFQSAILNYKRVCVLEPNNFEHYSRLAFIYFFQGQCLFDQKLYPEALESFSRAAEMRPEVIGYHTRSIACLAALERHGECLALVNKRLEADTGNADLYIMRARLHELFKNTTLCYYDVKDALALEPENSEALEMMERLKIKAKEMKQQAVQLNLVHRHRDALQKISMAIETDPSQPDYHITRGALQRRIGDYNAAIDDYLLAMDKTDHDEESDTYTEAQRQLLLTYNDFAVECFTKGFYEEAVILLNKAIKGEKNEKGLYINRGDCFFRQGNFQFALADYQQALEIDGRDDAIHSRIAVIHNEYGVQDYQDKNYQDAESRFTLAIQHCPKMAQYYISRCRARQVMENISGARQDLLMAMHLDPSSDEITSLMARLFPGKTVKDVLRSDAAVGVRQAFENLTIMSPPVRLAPLNEESREIASAERTFSARAEQEKTDSFDISSTWKPGYTFPSLKACMVERDFNIKIVSGKKRINDQIKNKLHNRKPLNQDGSRILPLSEPVQYTQVGGRAFHTQKITVNAINDSGSNKKSTGWKTFSLGIGLNGIPDKL